MKRLVLLVLLLISTRVEASSYVAIATGNLTTGATWATPDTVGTLVSTSNTGTALTTGNLDSASFVLGASQVYGFAFKLFSRAAGSPSNTMTVTLRNSTTASDTCAVTLNVSDLPEATSAAVNGGWHAVKCSAAFTPNGTDSYVIRATLSATSTAVSLYTNGTANNWQHIVMRTTTGAPGAGDDMFINEIFDGATNPATVATVTVTMDQTAATDYGSNNTNGLICALCISKGGTLTWGTTASTAYLLQLSGWLLINAQGTYNMGTSGTPIPSSSTATLQFDLAGSSDGGYGWVQRLKGVYNIYGSPRTAGKNVTWTHLTADAASGTAALTVADDTGWKNTDFVQIATTTRTTTQTENKQLGADAGASSLTLSTNLASTHAGASAPLQAEVALTTRNVTITSTSSTNLTGMHFQGDAGGTMEWAAIVRCGGVTTSTLPCVNVSSATGGTFTFNYDHFDNRTRANPAYGLSLNIVTPTVVTFDNCTFLQGAIITSSNIPLMGYGTLTGALSITNSVIWSAVATGSLNNLFWMNAPTASTGSLTVANTHIWGGSNTGDGAISLTQDSDFSLGTVSIHDITIHSSGGHGITGFYNTVFDSMTNLTITNLTAWRNNGTALRCELCNNLTFDGADLFGNGSSNLYFGSSGIFRVKNSRLTGDSSFSTTFGINGAIGSSSFCCAASRANAEFIQIYLDNDTFGSGSGTRTTHASGDINFGSFKGIAQVYSNNTLFSSATEFASFSTSNQIVGSFIADQKHDQTNGNHSTRTLYGTVAIDTSTYEQSPSIKLTPTSATVKLESNGGRSGRGLMAPVASGAAITVGWDVFKDASYNGNQPRLILKANFALGVASDTVIATMSVGTNTWETLTGTSPTASDSGVFEFIVDVDGTAGNAYADNPTISGGAIGDSKWLEGLPVLAGPDVGGGGAGGEHAYPIFR